MWPNFGETVGQLEVCNLTGMSNEGQTEVISQRGASRGVGSQAKDMMTGAGPGLKMCVQNRQDRRCHGQ